MPDTPSTFSLRTQRDTFLAIGDSSTRGPEIRGDADTISFNTTFRIRMQARFKPKLKASKEEKAYTKMTGREMTAEVRYYPQELRGIDTSPFEPIAVQTGDASTISRRLLVFVQQRCQRLLVFGVAEGSGGPLRRAA